jgi:hypothetical protein
MVGSDTTASEFKARCFFTKTPGERVGAYRTVLVDGEMGFLEWTRRGDGAQVDDGVDSYLIPRTSSRADGGGAMQPSDRYGGFPWSTPRATAVGSWLQQT